MPKPSQKMIYFNFLVDHCNNDKTVIECLKDFALNELGYEIANDTIDLVSDTDSNGDIIMSDVSSIQQEDLNEPTIPNFIQTQELNTQEELPCELLTIQQIAEHMKLSIPRGLQCGLGSRVRAEYFKKFGKNPKKIKRRNRCINAFGTQEEIEFVQNIIHQVV